MSFSFDVSLLLATIPTSPSDQEVLASAGSGITEMNRRDFIKTIIATISLRLDIASGVAITGALVATISSGLNLNPTPTAVVAAIAITI